MDHVAIMKKSLGFLPKIVSGEKTIETRFYNSKRTPWNKIQAGDRVFFKNTGESVTVTATVSKVLFNPKDLIAYQPETCLTTFPSKKYAILIFLKDIKQIKPFAITKKGFGAMASWITVPDIVKIRL